MSCRFAPTHIVHAPPFLQLPVSPTHRLHKLPRRDVAQVHRGRVQAGVAELLLDEGHGHALEGELGGARVVQPIRMHALLEYLLSESGVAGGPAHSSRPRPDSHWLVHHGFSRTHPVSLFSTSDTVDLSIPFVVYSA